MKFGGQPNTYNSSNRNIINPQPVAYNAYTNNTRGGPANATSNQSFMRQTSLADKHLADTLNQRDLRWQEKQ